MVTDPIKFVYKVGDGVTTDFSYAYNGTVGFDADVAEDVRAAILNPDGTRDTNPNFAVLKDTYGNFTGAIRFATAPVANAVVYIYRATPQTQETEYKTSSGFDAKNVENDFDKLTKLVQETSSHARNKTVQLDMFQEEVLKFILASEANQNQMLFFDFNTLTFRFTSFTKGQAVISSASASDDKTDIMLSHLTDEDTGLPYLAFSLDQGATWKPMNFAEISAIANSANAKAQEALDNSETAVSTSNDAKAIAQNAATDAENAVQTATNSTDIANAANATAESAKTTATNASTKADTAVSTADSALQKANTAMVQSSDALADAAVALENSEQAVATANAAKNTADGIDGKATSALTNSEQAVATANAAKNTADGIDGKATSALTNSEQAVATANEAKNTADGIDAKINDVQGDVDTLNTKVPSNASASNKMATAAEISNLQNQIDTSALEIKGLQGAGGALTATNMGANPTQQAITEYAIDQIWPNNTNFTWNASNPAASTFTDANGIARTAAEIFNGTWVNNTADNMRWQLTNTQNTTPTVFEWANVGQDIVGIANTTTAGIIRVGSGSQMVVNPTTGDISLDGTKAESIRGTIGAVATNQGTANAGKVLTVGDDGNIELADGASGASGAGRNIGDIFWTTRTDSALNGAVEANGAQYNFADVNGGDNNIQALLEAGKLPYVSIAEFNAMVAEQGGCDSFGYGTDELTLYPVKEWKASGDSVLYAYSDKTFYTDYDPERQFIYFTNSEGEIFEEDEDINAYFLTVNLYDKDSLVLMDGYHPYYDMGVTYIKKPNGELISGENLTIDDFSSRNVDAIVKPSGGEFQSTTYFKVPKKLGRVLVRCQKPTADNDYTWYNLYSDGWVEQGGFGSGADWKNISVSLPIEMSDVNYTPIITTIRNATPDSSDGQNEVRTISTTGFVASSGVGNSTTISWQVSGYANSAEYTKDKWDYQNVQVERPMVQLFNSATDEAVATCTEVLSDVADLKQTTDGMIDYVVESQEPTSANGYTWYRLYKSGWVEQGGILQEHRIPAGHAADQTLTLPIEMADTNYTVTFGAGDGKGAYQSATISRTTTGGTVTQMNRASSASFVIQFSYIVSGMSAQGVQNVSSESDNQ